ncbi:MAG TPA: DUF488 domain-containing protein [Nitrospira sp.]|nr:DUF488 domain-containing protein [Nitrospira sp.]
MSLAIKRIYEPPRPSDGFRVLVDRVWPRGMSKAKARVDEWLRDVAPSTGLRKWFNHDPARWKEFAARYRAELKRKRDLLAALRERAKQGPVTLLYSAHDPRYNQAVVLKALLSRSTRSRKPGTRRRRGPNRPG